MSKKTVFFLLLSFIEGGSVMAAELLGAKLLAPFFGSSLYVWSSVMAVTLLGLAIGYFIGGTLSTRPGNEKRLYVVLVIGAVMIALMPFTVQFCFALFSKMSLLKSVIASSICLLVPPVFLMGMVSPLIISLVDTEIKNPGKSSGTVYAVSTVGGIIATFLFGFYIIPKLGLSIPCIATAVLLGIIPAALLLARKNLLPFLLAGSIWFSLQSQSLKQSSSRIKVVDLREGILGQLLVVDYPGDYYYTDSTRKNQPVRYLFVNRISQTMDDKFARSAKGEERYFRYVYKIAEALDTLAGKNKKILLLGLGGGSVANYLSSKGFKIEVCELDARMYDMAQNYFGLSNKVKVTIDDARHFINVCEKKYDVIIFDTFKGEEAPNHVLTTESLQKIKVMLNPGGLVFVNSFGFWKKKRGRGMRSIYKTFEESGFSTIIQPTHPAEEERNLLFMASVSRNLTAPAGFLELGNELSDAEVLTDSKPVFEKMNSLAALSWRRSFIQRFLYDSLERQLPFFY
ncbi:MAG TPA: fused MFS/spermidine synthase [Flavobacteriales bacterium]|nr:fused MFS/spermidine synthase [Flavobacteriales bacterium]